MYTYIQQKLGESNWFLMENMCKFQILSITHKTIILRKPNYLNKLLNEELMRNIRLQYYNLFSVPKIHLMRIRIRSFGWAAPNIWNSLPKSLRRIRRHHQFRKIFKIYFEVTTFFVERLIYLLFISIIIFSTLVRF